MKKALEEEYVPQFIDMQKLILLANMKYYHKNKELSHLKYWDVNNLYGRAMSQKLPVNNFEWIDDTFQFNEDFIKGWYNEID